MKMRPPAIPLITIDPYFSVWSSSDKLNESTTLHWTGKANTINGYVYIDGEKLRFMGEDSNPKIEQVDFTYTALTSKYVFKNEKISLKVEFISSMLMDDLYCLSTPISYLTLSYSSIDGNNHTVSFEVVASEELCINLKNEEEVAVETVNSSVFNAISIGSTEQNVLGKCGDDIRINWGYFYLCGDKCSTVKETTITSSGADNSKMKAVSLFGMLTESEKSNIVFAYDDIYSVTYFGEKCKAYWKKDGIAIEKVIENAFNGYDRICERVYAFDTSLRADAQNFGGEQYADILELAYRQVLAGHKLVTTYSGEMLYVSKECFSNGCAMTVDISYPSSPMFILYNIDLLKAMLKPILDYSNGDSWPFDFAPHDLGRYPFLNGQVYSMKFENQMPVEECGNMLIMIANVCIKEKSGEFAKPYLKLLSKWCDYLIKFGNDPENQLCTDDFAGHLAHNCNLSVKAIMGIAGFSIINSFLGENFKAEELMSCARNIAQNWIANAANKDGSYKLAFDKPDTYSMKYNMVWDKIWGTKLFPESVYVSEFDSYKKHLNPYGMPLDSRADYTKSDWLIWTALLAPTDEDFECFVRMLWNAYNDSESRVPLTDWYDTLTSKQSCWIDGDNVFGFKNRTVQGGLFIKLLQAYFKQ